MMLDLDKHPDTEVSLVELAVSQWFYWVEFAGPHSGIYQKILVPLDMTEEAARVLPEADKLLRSEGEGILLHVIQTNTDADTITGRIQRELDRQDVDHTEAMEYLTGLAGRVRTDSNRWRCDVIEAPSVADGVASYATRESVDVIVMNLQERKGLAKLIRRSIAKEIKQKAPVDVRVFRESVLALR